MFKFNKTHNNEYTVTVSGALIGFLFREVDGYFTFEGGGSFKANELRDLAEKLDELNREYDELVSKLTEEMK